LWCTGAIVDVSPPKMALGPYNMGVLRTSSLKKSEHISRTNITVRIPRGFSLVVQIAMCYGERTRYRSYKILIRCLYSRFAVGTFPEPVLGSYDESCVKFVSLLDLHVYTRMRALFELFFSIQGIKRGRGFVRMTTTYCGEKRGNF